MLTTDVQQSLSIGEVAGVASSVNECEKENSTILGSDCRLESIMLQNLLIMLFDISPIFCLLCSFLCFLGMHHADDIYL